MLQFILHYISEGEIIINVAILSNQNGNRPLILAFIENVWFITSNGYKLLPRQNNTARS